MADALLTIDNVVKRFDDATILDGISFSVKKSEVIVIVGPSGCGKSTILNLISGLLKPEAGTLLSRGRPITEADLHIGYMLQRDHLFEWRTIYSNVLLGLEISRTLTPERKEKVGEMMETYGLKSFSNARPSELSGGMRQRVMIAMALACKPKILIADEPTTALDVTIQAQILHLMNELQRENGTAIIFITHDLGVINEMADDVVVMYCGQVVEQASARTIFSQDCPASHPYTEGLMHSIPRMDNVGTKLKPIPGVVPHPLALPKGCKFAPRCKYCTQKCIDAEPELKQVAEGQYVRCFYPDKEERRSAEHGKIVVHY